MTTMKVAIVHDYLKEYGGAERVVEALLEVFPGAPVYTTIYLPKYAGPHRSKVEKWNIRTSFLQNIPFSAKLISPFRFIAPLVFKSIDLSSFDVVIVSAAGTYTSPNYVKVGDKTLFVCYCHTPPRYLYGYPTANPWKEILWRKLLLVLGQIPMHFLRIWDYKSAQKPDYFIANSKEVASRIEKFYRRDSTVIYPPVDVPNDLGLVKKENFYLTGGRLSRHKGQDLAVKACTKLGLKLKVFGGGFAAYGEKQLKEMAGPTVEFLGEITDKEKWDLMSRAKGFIFPSEKEDFGIVPVEAMAAGTPVIALGQGGVLETVVDGKTGVLFGKRSLPSLISAIKRFEKMKFSQQECKDQAKMFSKLRIEKEIKQFIKDKYAGTSRS